VVPKPSKHRELLSSALLSVEGRRAARRYGEPAAKRAHAALTAITLIPLDQPILDTDKRALASSAETEERVEEENVEVNFDGPGLSEHGGRCPQRPTAMCRRIGACSRAPLFPRP
jgi:hypothetical protein